ncbi:MAG: CPBP family intramembrane metalloprotease [bacterium]|nr:CPBP family intramembrane metalloprotease [bacterium]
MNPLINKAEMRMRAGIRIPVFMVFSFLIITIGNSLPLNGAQYLITSALVFGYFWISFRFVDNRSDISLAGLQLSPLWWREFGVGCVIAVLAMLFIFLVELASGDLIFMGFSWQNAASNSWLFPFLIFFFQMLNVGFYEEVMSRSYLIPNFKEGFTMGKISPTMATIGAVIFSSIFFSVAHGFNPNLTLLALLNIALAGVMLAIPYLLTGRLALSVGIHFAWNFAQGGIFGFRVSGLPIRGSLIQIQQAGNPTWTGGAFGPEGGIIGTLAIILVAYLCVIWIRKKKGNLEMAPVFTNSYLQNEGRSQENP